MEMRDSLLSGRIRMDAEGTAQAQAKAQAHPLPSQDPPARQPFASASSAGSVARRVGRAVSMMFSRGDELHPYKSWTDHLHEFIPLPVVCLLLGCAMCTALIATFAQPEFHLVGQGAPCTAGGLSANCTLRHGAAVSGECILGLTQPIDGLRKCPLEHADFHTPAPKWKAYFVMNGIVLTIGAITMGAPVAPTILVTNVCFVFTKIVTEKEAFAGFGSPSVVALAILFVLSAAVERSGLLEPLIDGMMGDGSNPAMSRIRLIVPTMFMSGFVSNTPLLAMIMPFAINWAERRGLEPFDYLMPLAFAANIGGTLTQIGSPPNLVVFERVTPTHPMGMFFQSPLAMLCFLAFALYTYFLGPCMLKVSIRPQSLGRTDKPEAELYCIRWVVMEDSDLVGHTWRGHGLLRLSGTRLESVSRRAPGGEAPPVPEDQVLEAGDVLVARCDAADVSKLRHVRGLLIAGDAGEAVRRLGANRRRRCLFECVLRPGIDAAALDPGAADLRAALLSKFQSGLIAHRGPAEEPGMKPRGGNVALLEADEGSFESRADRAFALVRKIPGSAPPRVGRHADPVRAYASMAIVLSVIGMCILVSVPAVGLGDVWLSAAPLASMSVVAAALLVAGDVLTLKDALNSINVQAYVGIAASVGMGKALETSGVARMIAGSLVAMAKAAGCGALGVSAAMFVAACMLSNVVTNTAVAVLVMPIAESIAAEEGIDVRVLGALVILASNFALATPFACATNIMVMAPLGPSRQRHSFGDYVRFGAPLQILLVVTALVGVQLFYGPLDVPAGVV